VRLTGAAYTYYSAWRPALAVGGQLDGPLPPGRSLLAAGWADPATIDSTAAHNLGNGLLYPGDELTLSDQDCFTVSPYSLGYGGYTGLTTRIYLLLVDTAKVLALQQESARLTGFTTDGLAARGVGFLGYVVVPAPTG
jgi:hypothetical protein